MKLATCPAVIVPEFTRVSKTTPWPLKPKRVVLPLMTPALTMLVIAADVPMTTPAGPPLSVPVSVTTKLSDSAVSGLDEVEMVTSARALPAIRAVATARAEVPANSARDRTLRRTTPAAVFDPIINNPLIQQMVKPPYLQRTQYSAEKIPIAT
ncbi:hypothetical protein [Nitrospirillum viridazoti]|uniref:hypothetical protein n=1 Tax=Nitrospirillum viridazoti TaxID=3144925 RepID=UPI001B3B5937|nr:hypothetical protein [Nitrospirillum amazonense]